MKKILFIILIAISSFSFADNTKKANETNAYKDGINFGKGNIPDLKEINQYDTSKFIDGGFTSNPEQKKYYGGVTGSDNQQLKADGLAAYEKSGVSDSIENAYKNKPKLDFTDPFVSNSLNMRDGIVTDEDGNFCIYAIQDKGSYTKKTCITDSPEKHYCKLVPKYDYDDVSEFIHIEKKLNADSFNATDFNENDTGYIGHNPNQGSFGVAGNDTVIANFPVPPKSTVYSYHFEHTFNGYQYKGGCNHPPTEGISFDINGYYTDYGHKPLKWYTNNVINEIKIFDDPFYVKNDNLVVRVNRNDWWHNQYGHPTNRGKFMDELKNGFRKFNLEIDIVAPKPKVSWVRQCDFKLDDQDSIPKNFRVVSNKCVVTKPTTLEQQIAQVDLNCYEYQEIYEDNSLNEKQTNQCKILESDSTCSQDSSECLITDEHGSCTQKKITYACLLSDQTNGYLCGNTFYKDCDKEDCGLTEQSGDFGMVISQLQSLTEAAKDAKEGDINNIKIFTGKGLECRTSFGGYNNCCADSGWGQSIGLAGCGNEEKELAGAKAKQLTVSLGEYCSKKVLGICLQKKRAYCAFNSKLAKIVQEQGRKGQLNIGFGSAKNPDCRGFTLDEFQSLDFQKIDYSSFFSDVMNQSTIPNQDKLKQKITDKYGNKYMGGTNK